MYVMSRTFEVEKSHVDELCQKWSSRKVIDGLLKKEILREARTDRDIQKVTILFYWESKDKYKAWQAHPEHVASHKNAPPRPDWVVGSSVEIYDYVTTVELFQ